MVASSGEGGIERHARETVMKTHSESMFVYADSHVTYNEDDKIPRVTYHEYVPVEVYTDLKQRLEKAEYSANGFESLYDAVHNENEQLKSRIATALDTIMRFGGINGDHHKAWVIDQTVRALTGDCYDKWVDDYKGETGPEGEREYDWDEGIVP